MQNNDQPTTGHPFIPSTEPMDVSEIVDYASMEIQADFTTESEEETIQTAVNLGDIFDVFTVEELKEFVLFYSVKVKSYYSFAVAERFAKYIKLKNSDVNLKSSKYNLAKVLDLFASCFSIHHVCGKCGDYIGKQKDKIAGTKMHCKTCNRNINVKSNLEAGNFFLYLSLGIQLQMFFSKYGDEILSAKKQENKDQHVIEDIFDGKGYKMVITENTITINFSYDGVPVFKSSKFSAHPILCSINELAPIDRKNHVFLTGLWFGKKKPKVNSFFVPFVKESKQLYNYGFNYTYNGSNFNNWSGFVIQLHGATFVKQNNLTESMVVGCVNTQESR